MTKSTRRPMSEEHKEKLRAAHLGKKHSPESIAKMKESQRKRVRESALKGKTGILRRKGSSREYFPSTLNYIHECCDNRNISVFPDREEDYLYEDLNSEIGNLTKNLGDLE